LEKGADLAKVKVCNIDKKQTVEIADEIKAGAGRLHEGKDDAFNKSKPILKSLPTWMLRPILWVTGYLTGVLGWNVKVLGLEAHPFGVCVITSVGMLGLDEGYAPPTPFARAPVFLAITSIKDRVKAVNGAPEIRQEIDLMATIDHRFLDGYQGAIIAKSLRESFDEPWKLDGYDQAPWKNEVLGTATPSPAHPIDLQG